MPSLTLLSVTGADIAKALGNPIIQNALIVGALVSLCSAMLGVILVLKRYALIGHGLGEVGFAAASIAALIGLSEYPMIVAIPLVCLSSVLIMRIDQKSRVGGDVLIGIFSTSALAAGVIASAFTTGYTGMYKNMFGRSVYALNGVDVWTALILSPVVIGAFCLMYHRLFSVTYDETYARATDINADFYQFIISLLTSVAVVLGMRVMGAMMISSFIIFPAMTARRLARSFRGMIVIAVAVALICFIAGMSISYIAPGNLPTGACVVLVSLMCMLIVYGLSALRARR